MIGLETVGFEEHQLLAENRRCLLKRIAIRPDHIHTLRVFALQIGTHHEPEPEIRTVGELADQLLVAAAIARVVAHLDVERRQIDRHLQVRRIIHRRELERLACFRIVPTLHLHTPNALAVAVEQTKRLPTHSILGIQTQSRLDLLFRRLLVLVEQVAEKALHTERS